MAHVLLAALPFAGHVIPFSGVIRELQERGHRVSFYSGRKYRDVIEQSGASLVPFTAAKDFNDADIERSFPEMSGRSRLSSMLTSFREVFFGTAPGQAQDIENLHRQDQIDLIISEGTCVGPSLVHETLGIPYITMSQAPMALGVSAVYRFAIDHTINAALTRMHNKARARIGLQPANRPGLEGTWSRTVVVAQGVRELERPRQRG